jgi:hypothetical protein
LPRHTRAARAADGARDLVHPPASLPRDEGVEVAEGLELGALARILHGGDAKVWLSEGDAASGAVERPGLFPFKEAK